MTSELYGGMLNVTLFESAVCDHSHTRTLQCITRSHSRRTPSSAAAVVASRQLSPPLEGWGGGEGVGGRSKKKLVHFHAAPECKPTSHFLAAFNFSLSSPTVSSSAAHPPSPRHPPPRTPPRQLHSGRRPLKAPSNVSGRLLV